MSFHPSLHLLNWDFVLSVSIKENEAAVDVTAFVSYSACRWWWKRRLRSAWRHTLDWTRKMCAVHVGTYTCCYEQRTLNQDPGRVCTTVASGRRTGDLHGGSWGSQSRYWCMKVHETPPPPPVHHLVMHHLDTRRPQGCKHRGVKRRGAVAPPIAVKEVHSRVHLLPRSCKLFLARGAPLHVGLFT